MDLFSKYLIDFNNDYLRTQLITYLGNKRALLPFINKGIEFIKGKLAKEKLISLDGFAGSGVVSRLLKYHSSSLCSNDLEKYSHIVNSCYLSNRSEVDLDYIKNTIDKLNNLELQEGFITKNYAPRDDNNIRENERVFYTHKNAQILDSIKQYIYANIPEDKQYLFLAPLLVEASIHANTSGIFKGFHKKDGVGHFGGKGENALTRIKGEIKLQYPIFSDMECSVAVLQEDINELIRQTENFDLAYYDPPYNQHPYGSNYFMLNIIANKDDIAIQDGVSGIAKEWNRSNYNKRLEAIESMEDLMKNTPAKYILLSYNNEGIIPVEQLQQILNKYGKVSLLEQDYNTYRGSRNLKERSAKVKELLWVVEK